MQQRLDAQCYSHLNGDMPLFPSTSPPLQKTVFLTSCLNDLGSFACTVNEQSCDAPSRSTHLFVAYYTSTRAASLRDPARRQRKRGYSMAHKSMAGQTFLAEEWPVRIYLLGAILLDHATLLPQIKQQSRFLKQLCCSAKQKKLLNLKWQIRLMEENSTPIVGHFGWGILYDEHKLTSMISHHTMLIDSSGFFPSILALEKTRYFRAQAWFIKTYHFVASLFPWILADTCEVLWGIG